jgi:hypothetical protein
MMCNSSNTKAALNKVKRNPDIAYGMLSYWLDRRSQQQGMGWPVANPTGDGKVFGGIEWAV